MAHDQGFLPIEVARPHSSSGVPGFLWILLLFFCLFPFSAKAGEVTLAWDPPSSEYGGFILAYGTARGTYTYSQDVGRQTMYTVPNLNQGQAYYFAVKAYNTTGSQESSFSNEVSAMIPAPPPQADFYATPTAGFASLVVAFTDASSGKTNSWFWDFGDGTTSMERHPSHFYALPGTYTVALTVAGEGGSNTKTASSYISVRASEGPTANFTATPVSGIGPLPVTFTDTSTGSITSWVWDFGDGSSSSIQNPSHIYKEPGTYSVSLTVTGHSGTAMIKEKRLIKVERSRSKRFTSSNGKKPK